MKKINGNLYDEDLLNTDKKIQKNILAIKNGLMNPNNKNYDNDENENDNYSENTNKCMTINRNSENLIIKNQKNKYKY